MKELKKEKWNYNPKIPIENNPLFSFPFLPKKIIKWYANMWQNLCYKGNNKITIMGC